MQIKIVVLLVTALIGAAIPLPQTSTTEQLEAGILMVDDHHVQDFTESNSDLGLFRRGAKVPGTNPKPNVSYINQRQD